MCSYDLKHEFACFAFASQPRPTAEVDPQLTGFGIPAEMGDFVRVKKSVMELETLLNLRFSTFRHKDLRFFWTFLDLFTG